MFVFLRLDVDISAAEAPVTYKHRTEPGLLLSCINTPEAGKSPCLHTGMAAVSTNFSALIATRNHRELKL